MLRHQQPNRGRGRQSTPNTNVTGPSFTQTYNQSQGRLRRAQRQHRKGQINKRKRHTVTRRPNIQHQERDTRKRAPNTKGPITHRRSTTKEGPQSNSPHRPRPQYIPIRRSTQQQPMHKFPTRRLRTRLQERQRKHRLQRTRERTQQTGKSPTRARPLLHRRPNKVNSIMQSTTTKGTDTNSKEGRRPRRATTEPRTMPTRPLNRSRSLPTGARSQR